MLCLLTLIQLDYCPRQVNICTHVISDRLYFVDSLLGLLSNAVKYSDRGAVIDVHIDIVLADPPIAIDLPLLSRPGSFIISSQLNSLFVSRRQTNVPSGSTTPLSMTESPMLSVRVVDSGIGLTGI